MPVFCFKNSKGQVVIEYILLIVITVGVAMILLTFVNLGDPGGEGGDLINYWRRIVIEIARD